MRFLLAADAWRPAHSGTFGTAWSLVHGLSARGHAVEVVVPEGFVPRAGPPAVRTLTTRWPPVDDGRCATDRLSAAATALPAIQRQMLEKLGPVTDSAAVGLVGVDALIAVGIESAHLRGLLRRAVGRVATVVHLGPSDNALLDVPVVRQALRPHLLVAPWEAWAAEAETRLNRKLAVLPPGIVADTQSSADGTAAQPARVRRAIGDRPYIVWVRAGPGPADRVVPAWQARSRMTVLLADENRTSLGRRFVHLSGPRNDRMDQLVADATAIVFSPGDAGDLALVAWLSGCPIIADEQSSVASDVAASGGGCVVGDDASLSQALATLGDHAAATTAAGRAFVAAHRTWDRVLPAYELLIEPRWRAVMCGSVGPPRGPG